jgi:hypothetical protein
VIDEMLAAYPRLRGLKIIAPKTAGDSAAMVVLGSTMATDLGQPGEEVHQSVFKRESIYYHKGKENVTLVMPLRDRNGEMLGAVELLMESFFGQTESNAIGRAMPIVKVMQTRIQTAKDLLE